MLVLMTTILTIVSRFMMTMILSTVILSSRLFAQDVKTKSYEVLVNIMVAGHCATRFIALTAFLKPSKT